MGSKYRKIAKREVAIHDSKSNHSRATKDENDLTISRNRGMP